jgi:phosphatidylserine/phosphatidylglycerophosphate/cardiolipin synthase-like enzyme
MSEEGLDALMVAMSEAVSRLPRELVDRIASLLTQRDTASPLQIGQYTSQPNTRKMLGNLLDRWHEATDLDDKAFAAALLSAKRAHDYSEESEKVEIVWTGPATSAVPVRRTEQVLKQLIDEAREDLLLVSFATYKVGDLKASLHAAIDRGVMIRMVLESESSSSGKVAYDEIDSIKKEFPEIAVYTWPLEKRPKDEKGRHGALHAKCAVADGRIALVSSANLTPYALEMNMELGLIVRGGEIPRLIPSHFDCLMQTQILILS